jgi:hypothetical protein
MEGKDKGVEQAKADVEKLMVENKILSEIIQEKEKEIKEKNVEIKKLTEQMKSMKP